MFHSFPQPFCQLLDRRRLVTTRFKVGNKLKLSHFVYVTSSRITFQDKMAQLSTFLFTKMLQNAPTFKSGMNAAKLRSDRQDILVLHSAFPRKVI